MLTVRQRRALAGGCKPVLPVFIGFLEIMMAECEFIEKCPFFNDRLENKAVAIEDFKIRYCRENNLNCARYMVANALGKEKMPPNLYPHEKEVAYLLIAQG